MIAIKTRRHFLCRNLEKFKKLICIYNCALLIRNFMTSNFNSLQHVFEQAMLVDSSL